MVEIGKRDMFERGRLPLEMFRHNRTCIGLDMETSRRALPKLTLVKKGKRSVEVC
jgi:hypothetical protein